jgi:hypothetical protein
MRPPSSAGIAIVIEPQAVVSHEARKFCFGPVLPFRIVP